MHYQHENEVLEARRRRAIWAQMNDAQVAALRRAGHDIAYNTADGPAIRTPEGLVFPFRDPDMPRQLEGFLSPRGIRLLLPTGASSEEPAVEAVQGKGDRIVPKFKVRPRRETAMGRSPATYGKGNKPSSSSAQSSSSSAQSSSPSAAQLLLSRRRRRDEDDEDDAVEMRALDIDHAADMAVRSLTAIVTTYLQNSPRVHQSTTAITMNDSPTCATTRPAEDEESRSVWQLWCMAGIVTGVAIMGTCQEMKRRMLQWCRHRRMTRTVGSQAPVTYRRDVGRFQYLGYKGVDRFQECDEPVECD